MLLTIQNIQKYFGAELCLRNISCVLDAQDRAGIIGENGAGKTTLIKIITGELYPDDGIVTLAHGATVGYLEQNSVLDPACTVYGEMENAFRSVLDAMDEMKRLERQMAECPGDHMLLERHAQLSAVVDAADGYNMDTQIKKILNGMAFPAPDYQKSVAVLSGGEHTRLCLAKLLLQKPDLLILDEPTNHLDFETMEWLESYLKTYPGAILVVSHDRYFLDAVCNRIFEIEDNTLTFRRKRRLWRFSRSSMMRIWRKPRSWKIILRVIWCAPPPQKWPKAGASSLRKWRSQKHRAPPTPI